MYYSLCEPVLERNYLPQQNDLRNFLMSDECAEMARVVVGLR